MKLYFWKAISPMAVGFLVLLHITATVCFNEYNLINEIVVRDLDVLPEEGINPDNYPDSLYYVSKVSIINNNFTTMPENTFDHLFSFSQLEISQNQLSQIPENIFKKLTQLQFLSLRRNHLKTLPENLFQGLKLIKNLDLSENQLTTLPNDIFKSQINLYSLNLTGNQFETLPTNALKIPKKLRDLSFRQNQLTTLTANDFDGLSKLGWLDLSENQISAIHNDSFKSLTNLGSLLLGRNHITTLPAHIFDSLTNAVSLDLNENQLTALPENIFQIFDKYPIFLNLSHNHLTSLDGIITTNTSLFDFDVSYNDLTALPADFFNRTYLFEFNVRGNKLKTLPKGMYDDDEYSRNINLNDNPWQCDNEFLNIFYNIRKNYDVVCADGETIGHKIEAQKMAKMCPAECNCQLFHEHQSLVFNCSNRNWTHVPSGLGEGLQIPKLYTISLNLDNNQIENLPNSTMPGFEFIKHISAQNNSIKSIGAAIIEHLRKFNVSVRLVGNPILCDDNFIDVVRFNKQLFDYKTIGCNDGEMLYQKIDRLAYWITDKTEDEVTRPDWTNSNEIIRKIKPDGNLGQICPPECNCLVAQQNTTVYYECSGYSFTRIHNYFYNGKRYWPLIKSRQLII